MENHSHLDERIPAEITFVTLSDAGIVRHESR